MNRTGPTARYRIQNQEIRSLIIEIELTFERIHEDGAADVCRRLILALNRKLTIHMHLEEAHLYPRLTDRLTPEEARSVDLSQNDLWALRADHDEWMQRWTPMAVMSENQLQFIQETRPVLERLRRRLDREVVELFSVVDQIGWSALTGVG